ncbi:hypothetical protein CJ030_MR3G001916 [Morella rubra]|uniref:Uncharacterized protein n=1 Tax=Morella rubra TaxID=262757 RepID=A0A6A1W7H1_9ROSI|nr:hypothetical protein CJ030_MR3G001916 [Morella rubra]
MHLCYYKENLEANTCMGRDSFLPKSLCKLITSRLKQIQEFYATILWVANLDEPSMEVTVRNTQVTFSPNELASFLGYKRPLAVFPNLPLSEMPRDISARLATLERKVGEVDSEWKKEVVVHRLALKDMASGA